MPDEFPGIEGPSPLDQGHIRARDFDEKLIDDVLPVSIDDASPCVHVLLAWAFLVGHLWAYLYGARQIAHRVRVVKL